ncbi:MAG: hypothetical protein ABI343_15910 [Burkholderiaceae bacterium]
MAGFNAVLSQGATKSFFQTARTGWQAALTAQFREPGTSLFLKVIARCRLCSSRVPFEKTVFTFGSLQ